MVREKYFIYLEEQILKYMNIGIEFLQSPYLHVNHLYMYKGH